ncbi:MAG: short-chain dehydrogenase/reductase [Reyranellaceae bacterium]
MDLKLAGSKVLVTGASKGIGLAVASAFAAEGCSVTLVARTEATLQAAQQQIRQRHNVGVETMALDIAAAGSAERIVSAFPDIDILVNNAGAIPGGDIAAITEDIWRKAWELKVFGYVNLSRQYFARMKARKSGVIANVIGLAATRMMFDYIAGTMGNAGLAAFTKALGSKSVDHNVRVFGVNPPLTETDRMVTLARTRAQDQLGDPERWRETLKGLPFDRPATPEEIADAVVFLASPRASYVSGIVLDIDAGSASRN